MEFPPKHVILIHYSPVKAGESVQDLILDWMRGHVSGGESPEPGIGRGRVVEKACRGGRADETPAPRVSGRIRSTDSQGD